MQDEGADLNELPDKITQQLDGFAGPFSTWILHSPARVMFDAGEGIATWLRNRVFLPEAVFLTHSHFDHIGGLPALFCARCGMRGSNDKPLTVYYPEQCEVWMTAIKEFAATIAPESREFVVWQPLEPGSIVEARKLRIESFLAKHGVPAVGYRVLEPRHRLKKEFVGLPGDEIARLRQKGVSITDHYDHVSFAITGDTGPGLDPTPLMDVDVLLHEATFLDGSHRIGYHHSTVEDAFELAAACNARILVLYHFSQRYSATEIRETVTARRQTSDFAGDVYTITGFVRPGVTAYDSRLA